MPSFASVGFGNTDSDSDSRLKLPINKLVIGGALVTVFLLRNRLIGLIVKEGDE